MKTEHTTGRCSRRRASLNLTNSELNPMNQNKAEELDYHIDASTFQKPLIELAEVLAQKLRREAPKLLSAPNYVAVDLHVLMRQAMNTYDLLFYLNADERRQTDCYWRIAYSVVTFPLIRNMIDCLYNITAILENPAVNGPWFRKSGFRKMLAALDDDESKYGGQPKWDSWIKKNRDGFQFQMRVNGLTIRLGRSRSDLAPVRCHHQERMFANGRFP